MIIIALVLFLISFLIVQSYNGKECSSGGASNSISGGGFAGRDYSNAAFTTSAARSVKPSYGRLTGVFKYMSPEDWPFESPDKAAMLNVIGRGPVSGIPTAPGETPIFDNVPEQLNIRV